MAKRLRPDSEKQTSGQPRSKTLSFLHVGSSRQVCVEWNRTLSCDSDTADDISLIEMKLSSRG